MPAVRRGIAAGEAGLARLNAFRIVVAYDGTDFAGWQSQAKARTVQGTLQEALGRLSDGLPVRVDGAGRTDAGVHAAGQVASFLLERDIAPDALARALNGLLPADVRVLSAAQAPPGFHARRSARSKLYRYVLDTGASRTRRAGATRGTCPGPSTPWPSPRRPRWSKAARTSPRWPRPAAP